MSEPDIRAIDVQQLERRDAPALEQGFRVIVSEEAFDRAVQRGAADTTREVGGVLVGGVYRDASGPYLLVETTIDALHADEQGAELTFTHATWDHVHRELEAHHAGRRIVGWYHTHPGFGVFLSDRDQFIHRSFFDLPHQVALVLDPKSREHGFFAWRGGEPERMRRHWVGRREHVHEPSPPDRPAQPAAVAAASPAAEPARAEPRSPTKGGGDDPERVSPWVVGACALVVGAAAGYWFGGRLGNDRLRDVGLALAEERALGARQAVGTIQGDLILLLRRTLDRDGLDRDLAETAAALERGLADVAPDAPVPPERVAELRRASALLAELRQRRGDTAAVLAQIHQLARAPAVDSRELARAVAEQRAALGQVSAAVAEEALARGDAVTARRLLLLAAAVDPASASAYRPRIDAVEQALRDGAAPGTGKPPR